MDLEYWATTDVGRVRDHNEDNFLIDKRLHLFVVCDGMGGHAAGEVASAMSVSIVREVLRSHTEVFERLEQDPENLANRKSVLTLVEHAITEACSRIFHAAAEDLAKKGMGTTCSLLLLAQGRGFIGHVGDSRIYLHRQDAIHQITTDHSLINEMIRLGKIKKGEEHNLPHKNAVTRAVGVNEFVEVDTWEFDVFGGDSFLVCSDGLSGYFKDDSQITELVNQESLQKITQDCIDFANAGGGKDNITAILVRVKGAQKDSENIQRTMEVLRANSFFRYLNYKELVQIVNLSESETVEKGDWIFEKGGDPGSMFLIVSGSMALKHDEDDTGLPLGPGEVIGEMALIDDTPQDMGAKALEDCELLGIRRDRFMGLLRSDERLAVKLLWNFLQNWTYRLRKFPYDQQRGRRVEGINRPTPPSGNLAFEDDRRDGHQPATVSGEFAETSPTKPPGAEGAAGTAKPTADTVKTAPADVKKPRKAAAPRISKIDPDKTVPDNGLGGLAWDDIIPPDLLDDEESLRETVNLEREVDRTGPMSLEDLRETIPSDRDNGLGRPISGESSTSSTAPRSQVLKRGKLVVGSEAEFDEKENTRTREVKPLSARASSKKPDSTLELDIDDDSVEEVN